MKLTLSLRKFTLTAHITFSVGWIGAAVAYLMIAITALTSQDDHTVRAAYLAMEPAGWYALVPMAIVSLLTGLVISLGTHWGVVQHYWVLFKLLLTAFATVVLLNHMPTVSLLASAAAETNSINSGALKGEILHAGGGVFLLLATTVLAVYKPRGMTLYGQRNRPNGTSLTKTPRWVKVFGSIVLIMVLLFVIGHITGNHGPGTH